MVCGTLTFTRIFTKIGDIWSWHVYLVPVCESVVVGSVVLIPRFVKMELKTGKLWLRHCILDTSFAYKLMDDYLSYALNISYFQFTEVYCIEQKSNRS